MKAFLKSGKTISATVFQALRPNSLIFRFEKSGVGPSESSQFFEQEAAIMPVHARPPPGNCQATGPQSRPR
ncbi:hypothetical protein PGT21_013101 [Puccinia graminis f. sp. tritici]|uniref:Uncharacterized protein n=1 Tax=Puccinia graminis f. sp. tritici TaxID=56615 RepID=A0A5B0LTE7_PUCGR|nr:hypothetical protein PGTUg99_021978 [Puccinia graminis f. sp. tritici]KAA1071616.1 hypothetical protein PGT21_013101 [Puccinia graminis f. sp. tritici]